MWKTGQFSGRCNSFISEAGINFALYHPILDSFKPGFTISLNSFAADFSQLSSRYSKAGAKPFL